MHIDKTHGILGIRPITLPERENKINQALFQRSQDIFVRSKETELSLEQSLEDAYCNLENQLGIINGRDVQMMAERISRKVPTISKEDIFYAMGVLSQYSSYKSWGHLESEFEKYNIDGINTNPLVKQNSSKKLPVVLTDVMAYLGNKNCSNFLEPKKRLNSAIILDNKFLTLMEENPEIIEQIREDDIKIIYLENFENGYNFFIQKGDFEEFTLNLLKKCEGKDVKTELFNILNEENLQKIENLGLSPIIIQNDVNTHSADIADNLNPIIPTKDEFCAILEGNGGSNLQNRINILNEVGVFVSPRQYCENMKILHEKVTSLAEKEDIEEIFYAIPNIEKSFSVANYVYQKVNDIPDEKFVNHNFKIKKSNVNDEMSTYPQKFAVVVLDDVSATGSSLLNGPFYYIDISQIRDISGKDVNVILAPMYSTKMAKEVLESAFDKTKNDGFNHFITTKMLPEYRSEMCREVQENPLVFYVGDDCLTSIIFPYMGPDTNDPRFWGIYEKMLYIPEAQKKA